MGFYLKKYSMTIDEFKKKYSKQFNVTFLKEEEHVFNKISDFFFKPIYKIDGINISLV